MDTQGHILVVNDDREIRMLVGDYLKKHGYRVSLAADGRQMREILAGNGIDLIVLDLMLPGEDGLSLCRDLRARSDLPVLMLTARTEPIDRVLGLEMGADDYLAKPFEPRELLARIRNILRRVRSLPAQGLTALGHRWRFAGWILDGQTHQLTSPQGVVVALSGAEYRLLQVFLTHPNRVLTRDQLMDLTRGREADPFDRSIFRLETSRSRDTGGTGLGLPIAANLLAAQGGTLNLHKRPDGGLEVRVRLPVLRSR